MDAEIAAFVQARNLPASDVEELHALVQRCRSSRYEHLGPLGQGGMGEVRRVRDRELGRTCAWKAIRPGLADNPAAIARFTEEIRVAAQLQHPNIPPVYDSGRLPDGRPWFTMKEIKGRTLSTSIAEVHAEGLDDGGLRRLVEVFARVCDGVGYAHACGVVHRDLKPDNVMVGAHGEVLVLDWGLAKALGRSDALWAEDVEPRSDEVAGTRAGGVLGTAAYMSPEQARGEVDRVGVRSDVYALGATLYEILAGRPPYEGRDARAVLRQVLAGAPEPPGSPTGRDAATTFSFGDELDDPSPAAPLPEELVALCGRCMAREPADRLPDGASVAVEVRRWLEGARKREKALEVVSSALALDAEVRSLRGDAVRLRAEGSHLLEGVPAWAPEDQKSDGWAALDAADEADRKAAVLELKREMLLEGALTHAPDLVAAHEALVDLHLARHRGAEAQRQEDVATRAAIRIAEHAHALPAGHPGAARANAYLRGDGALTLRTDPPDATVELYRFEAHRRRRIAVPFMEPRPAPLVDVTLPMGSYLCVLRHPHRTAVSYPVFIGRDRRWDGVRPGDTEPTAIRLPEPSELGDDDCLVPAGWFESGGDAEAVDGLPRRRLWCDELIVKRFPVTNTEYLAFLNDLADTGREDLAVRVQPRERSAGVGSPVYGRDRDGRFVPRADADGDTWHPRWPVFLVDWASAQAYAAWLAARTGKPWRLLGELEREKAARGVDGRVYPWGDGFDPSWCCMRASHPGRALPSVVDSYPVDTSVYGVRGLAGNVEDWCGDAWLAEGPVVGAGGVVLPPAMAPEDALRARRGGHWLGTWRTSRAAGRYRLVGTSRSNDLGFRLAYRRA